MAFVKFENLGNGVRAVQVETPGGAENAAPLGYIAGSVRNIDLVGDPASATCQVRMFLAATGLETTKSYVASEIVKDTDVACTDGNDALTYLLSLNFKQGGGGQGVLPPQYSSVFLTGSSSYVLDGNTAVYYVDTSAGDVVVSLAELPEDGTTRIIKIVNAALSGNANALRVNLVSGEPFAGQSFTDWYVWSSDSVEFLGAKPTGLPTNWGISSDPEASFKNSIEDPIIGTGTYIDAAYDVPLPVVVRNDNDTIFQVLTPTELRVNLANYRRLKVGYYVYFEDTGFSSGWNSEVWLENNGLEIPATRTEFRNYGEENASHTIYESVPIGEIDPNFPIILKVRATGTTSNSITICRTDIIAQV